MKNCVSSCILAGFSLSIISTQAMSQTSTSDEIIVTAQRRVANAQDVSTSLTVIDGERLTALGIETINNLENYAPNLEIENQFGSGQPSFSIRGVGFRDYATNNAPTVGIYVDDVAYPVPVTTQGVLFDIERVEILRGPQGTLYGRNTTGGAIKVISNRPTDEFSAGLRVDAARFGEVEAEGFVSGAITDNIRVRVSGLTTHGGAWQINRETGEELGDAERYGVRALAEITLSDRFSVTVNTHGFWDNSDGLGLQVFTTPAFGPTALHGRRETSFGPSAEFANSFGLELDQAPFKDNAGFGGSLTATANFASLDAIYIGSFETLDRSEYNDFDASPLGAAGTFFESDVDVMSHELRVQSNTPSALQWIGGVYYSTEDLDEVYRSDFVEDGINGLAVFTPYSQEVETIGIFGQADLEITRNLKLIAGLRYENEDRDLIDLGTFATILGPLNFANGTVDGTLESRSQNLSEVTWKAGLDYTPSDNLLLYASASRGVKSGGFTAYNTLNPDFLDPFEAEVLRAYEAGWKWQSSDQNWRINGGAFYYDYDDQQVQSAEFAQIVAFGIAVPIGRIINAPQSEIYGGELELVWSPTPTLQIGQSLGYKDGKFIEFVDLDIAASSAAGAAVTIDRAGQSLGIPNVSYQGYATHQMPISSRFTLQTSLDYSFRDDTTPPLLGDVFRVEDYWLVNARVTLLTTSDQWELSLWGRNILNADYDETRNFFTPGFNVAAPGLPVTYGVSASVRF